jgi:hypothetical protein
MVDEFCPISSNDSFYIQPQYLSSSIVSLAVFTVTNDS